MIVNCGLILITARYLYKNAGNNPITYSYLKHRIPLVSDRGWIFSRQSLGTNQENKWVSEFEYWVYISFGKFFLKYFINCTKREINKKKETKYFFDLSILTKELLATDLMMVSFQTIVIFCRSLMLEDQLRTRGNSLRSKGVCQFALDCVALLPESTSFRSAILIITMYIYPIFFSRPIYALL